MTRRVHDEYNDAMLCTFSYPAGSTEHKRGLMWASAIWRRLYGDAKFVVVSSTAEEIGILEGATS